MSTADADSRSLAQALGRVPSGVFVLTVRRGGVETAMLGSWLQQCSFDPPLISVALGVGRGLLQFLTDGSTFTVNILPEGVKDLLVHFGRGFAPDEPAFTGIDLLTPAGATGPVLARAVAWLDAQVNARHQAGDHEIVVARITAGGVLRDERPATHVRKNGMHY